jgi:hypothetical protein
LLLLATNKLFAVFLPIFAAIVGTFLAIYTNMKNREKDE